MEQLKPTILAVDDEPGVIESYRILLEDDYNLLVANRGEDALEILKKENVDLILMDILMPGMDGIETLRKAREINEDVDVIMVTAVKTIKTAIDAIRLGAYDYVTKPFDADEMTENIKKVMEKRKLTRELTYLRSELDKTVKFDALVTVSEDMKKVLEVVHELTKNDATVIISGESGTGKELIARAIHYNSFRKDKPFVAVDCAAMPDNLLESELFGYEKGAFTDATAQKIGKLELANSGTLFLDEIGNLKMDMQSKLLRVLQEREFQRLGGIKNIKFDVRLISASNVDLKKALKEGRFREDLYYRINVVPINLPPLRDRKDDIPLLVDQFLKMYNREFNKNVKEFSAKSMNYLINYPWPGNIRELKNVVERIVALAKEPIISHRNLPLEILLSGEELAVVKNQEGKAFKHIKNQFETQYLLSILDKVRWNQTKAAKLLGVHRNTIVWKMRVLGLREYKGNIRRKNK